MERVKPIMQTSLVFESALADISKSDYVLYNEAKKEVWYYGVNNNMKPYQLENSLIRVKGKTSKDGRIETRIVGGLLKLLIYENNNNIAFVACKKVADNKAAFLKLVEGAR